MSEQALPAGWRLNENGTATDDSGRRTWMRVPYGMDWKSSAPSGKPKLLSWWNASKQFGEGVLAYKDRAKSSFRSEDWDSTDIKYGYKQGSFTPSFRFAGETGWRLPTAKEWCSVQFDGDVSISRLLFPFSGCDQYWTASLKYRLNLLVVKDVVAWKGWFGRPINDENAKHELAVLLVRSSG